MSWMNALSLGRQHAQEDRAIADQQRLGKLSAAALTASPDGRNKILGQVAAIDPNAAFGMRETFQREDANVDERTRGQLVFMAKTLAAAPEAMRGGLYSQMVEPLRRMGVQAPDVWQPDLMGVVQSLAGADQNAGALSPRMRSLQWAKENGHITEEQFRQGVLIEQGLAPSAVAGSMGYVEGYDPVTGATYRKPVMNRGLTYTGGPLVGEAGGAPAQPAQPNSLEITPTGEAPMPDDPAVMAQIVEGMRSGQPFRVSVPPRGAPTMARPPAPGAQSEMDRRANATLDRQTYSTPSGPIQSGPTTAQRAAAEAEVAAAQTRARIDAEGDATGNFQQESALRAEFEKNTAGPRDVISAYNRVAAAARSPTAAGDLSLIFGYMKMLDPGSVVREGEFANAQNAAGVPDRIINTYNNLMRGERLNPAQRADFLRQAAGLRDQAQSSIESARARARQLAESYGFDPDRVAAPGANDSGGDTYEVGEIIEVGGKRYRVTGGSPSDPDIEEI